MVSVFFVHGRLSLKRDAHAIGDNDAGNNKNIAGKNEPERNEVFEARVDPVPSKSMRLAKTIVNCKLTVDPVPFIYKKIFVMGQNRTVRELIVVVTPRNVQQIAREEEMTVAAEKTEENGTPHDDDSST
jgi:hypothetical protein